MTIRDEYISKKYLTLEIADQVRKDPSDVALVIDTFLYAIIKHLSRGRDVQLKDFGKIKIEYRGPRKIYDKYREKYGIREGHYTPVIRLAPIVRKRIQKALKGELERRKL